MKVKKIIVLIFLIFLIASVPITFFSIKSFNKLLSELPKLDLIKRYRPYQISRVLDSADNIIAELGIEKRTVIPVDTLPDHVKNAFIAAEDSGFYRHRGIDYLGVLRAVLYEIKFRLIGGQRIGGSTITQQTAKTFLLSRQQTYRRKIKELILARKIENILTKNQILNLYLNQIYFGNASYGIEEAAKTYYGVSAYKLTLSQAASLASVPKSPNSINPIKNPDRVKQRRDYILNQMFKHGLISENDARNAKAEPIILNRIVNPYLNKAPYFMSEAKKFLIDEFGENRLNRNGFIIRTSLNINIQIAANESLKLGLRNLDKRQGYRGPIARLPEQDAINIAEKIRKSTKVLEKGAIVEGVVRSFSKEKKEIVVDLNSTTSGYLSVSKMNWAKFLDLKIHKPIREKSKNILEIGDIILVKIEKMDQNPTLSLEQKPLVNGAVVVIDPENQHVLAMVGGYDFVASNFNRATKARRQPGSSFKPFIYAAAIDKGIVTSSTLIENKQRVYPNWKPKNDNGKFSGYVPLRTCLVNSINMCSIAVMEEVGIRSVINLVDRAGEVTKRTQMPRDLSLALGTGEVVPFLHVNAYTIFPGGGKIGKPIFIKNISSKEGKIIFEPKKEIFNIIKPGTAFIMTDIMRGFMKNSSKNIIKTKAALAGKTGTTNDFRNAWFVGFSRNIVAGVYVGFDDNRPLGANAYGATVALPIWGDLMDKVLKIIPAGEFAQPQDVVWRLIDLKTGNLLHPNRTRNFEDTDDNEEIDQDEIMHLFSIPKSVDSIDLNEDKTNDEKQAALEVFISGTEPLN